MENESGLEEIRIVRATTSLAGCVDQLRSVFTVKARILLSNCGCGWDFDVEQVGMPYQKEEAPTSACLLIGRDDAAVFLAFAGDTLVGQICVQKDRNGMARVWNLRVEHGHRHHGIATSLMDTVVNWARDHGLHWLHAETQDIHVTACMFYRDYGFMIGGFDRLYLQATQGSEGETAIFWYFRI